MISADRMKSVRIADDDHLLLVGGRLLRRHLAGLLRLRLVTGELLPDLLRALVTEVGAADHQDRGEQERRELAQQQRDRQDDQQLVAQRSLGDPPDDREFPLGFESLHVPRGHRCVVDHHPGRLDAGPAGAGRDVVQRRRRQLDQRSNVIEKGKQTTHAAYRDIPFAVTRHPRVRHPGGPRWHCGDFAHFLLTSSSGRARHRPPRQVHLSVLRKSQRRCTTPGMMTQSERRSTLSEHGRSGCVDTDEQG